MPESCFGPDFLTKLEYLALVARRLTQGALPAQRRSRQLGAGLEFAEHRPYTASEDYRHLDWNIYARLGALLVKRFQEDQDLQVTVLLDASRSMGLGAPPKFDYARRVAAALAYVALADLDRAGVAAFSGDLEAEFPPARGKERVLALLRFLDGLAPAGTATDLSRAAGALVRRSPRRGLAILVSDFFDRGGFRTALDVLRHHGYDVHVVQVYDPAEADPGLRGDVELIDVESQTRRRLTVTPAGLRRYRELFGRFCEELRLYCRDHGFTCTQTSTAVPVEDLVLCLMRGTGAVA